MDMNITLNIVCPKLCEAINNMAGAMIGNADQQPATPHTRKSRVAKIAEVAEPTESTESTESTEITPDPVADPAPIVTKPTTGIVQAAAESTATTEKASVFTLEDVRAKLIELSTAGHKDEIKAMFAKFGAKKLTEVPADKFAELMDAAGMIS